MLGKISSSRRAFLVGGATIGGATFAATTLSATELLCLKTPAQTAGPFYPGESNFTWDTDLTLLPGNKQSARGQVIYLGGQVLDQQCNPVPNANVEIWQACYSGRYNNRKDPNPAPLDPNFRYWGETQTSEQGEYQFKSIIPGAYPADTGWDRPPHIHVKVSALGFKEIITQMYFAGEPLNEKDLILQSLTPEEQASVIVKFDPVNALAPNGPLKGHFKISIEKIRGVGRE